MGRITTGSGLDVPLHGAVMTERKTLLLAEDNPGDVFLIRRALDSQNFPYELLVAKDGEQAISRVREAAAGALHIDLLMVDLNLPRHDGAEVLSILRAQDNLQDIPVMVLTSSDSPQDRERCAKLQVDHYFQKPSNLAAFMQVGRIAKDLLEAA